MPRRGDLEILLGTARQLSKLCEQGAALVEGARTNQAGESIVMAARGMHSQLLRTKHAVEDELVAWALDCERCGLRIHWVPGEGCELGH